MTEVPHFPVTDWNPPDDPVLGVAVQYNNETRPNKVNLGVGNYRTAAGAPFVLSSVRAAEAQLVSAQLDKEYLPIDGAAAYRQAMRNLIFGPYSPNLPVYDAQSVGGTGALRAGADYLALSGPRTIYLSDPTWANHRNVFSRAGHHVEQYPYFSNYSLSLDFTALMECVETMERGSVMVLHVCCHNPTGLDLARNQWGALAEALQMRGVIPFLDCAYQGFGEGPESDVYPIRLLAQRQTEFLVAYSCAKNFGLYGERVGYFALVARNQAAADRAGRQVRPLLRASYSNPPLHGERIVTAILQSESLKADWIRELEAMRVRVIEMRKALAAGLCAKGLQAGLYNILLEQRGLFSYGFLTSDHVRYLRQEFAVYCLEDGRINVAGLNPANVGYVIDAIESAYAAIS